MTNGQQMIERQMIHLIRADGRTNSYFTEVSGKLGKDKWILCR